MNERHVPSLEISQEFDRLCNEKGIIVPATEFYWNVQSKKVTAKKYRHSYHSYLDESSSEQEGRSQYKNIPAPIVSELGEWLPARIVLQTKLLKKEESVVLYYIKYEDDASDCDGTNLEDCVKTKWTVECGKEIIRETTEANARMKMWNYLIAEGIITEL